MTRVSKEDISRALEKTHKLDIRAKELICDELFIQQPNLLASVIVQQKMGNSMNDVDILLHILIVLHLAIKEAGIKIAKISEQEQIRQLEILKQSVLFSEGMPTNLVESSIDQYISNHKEPHLLSYVLGAMQEADFFKRQEEHSKYLLMAGINLVSCMADARKTRV